MKYLTLAILGFSAINFFAQPNESTNKEQNQSTGNPQKFIALAYNEKAANDTQAANGSPPRWSTPLERPEWWGIIVAVITCGVIAWQAVEMRRATGAMNRSTQATEKSVGLLDKQAGLMEGQLKEMRAVSAISEKTLVLSSDTARKQLRAYVCVDSAVLKFPRPDVPEAQVHFKNYGQTPAYDFRGWIHTWFKEYPINEALPTAPHDLRKGMDILAPGRRSIFVAPLKPPLPQPLVALLGTQQFTLYVYGEVHYRDAFGEDRRTKYRMIHGGTEGVRKVPDKEEWLLKPDAEGNEAT